MQRPTVETEDVRLTRGSELDHLCGVRTSEFAAVMRVPVVCAFGRVPERSQHELE